MVEQHHVDKHPRKRPARPAAGSVHPLVRGQCQRGQLHARRPGHPVRPEPVLGAGRHRGRQRLGMLLTALHAWQGPRLGVPQMIQSRGQFGFYGASFICSRRSCSTSGTWPPRRCCRAIRWTCWCRASACPCGSSSYAAGAGPGHLRLPVDPPVQKVMTAVFFVVIVVAPIEAATYGSAVPGPGLEASSCPIFVAMIGLFFMNMLSSSPTADYSRVPRRTSASSARSGRHPGGNVIPTDANRSWGPRLHRDSTGADGALAIC